MTEPLSVDRVFGLLTQAKKWGMDDNATARFIAEASLDGGAGPKPEDYLTIHVRGGVVAVSVNTHYVNHGNTWQPRNTAHSINLTLPPKPNSQFVTVDLPDLGLERKTNEDPRD